MSFLRNGSDEYYKLKEEADYIGRNRSDARTTEERNKWIDAGRDLVREMHAEYGLGDKEVKNIIEENYLDRY